MKKITLIFIGIVMSQLIYAQSLETQLNTHLKTLQTNQTDLTALYQVVECYTYLGGREEALSMKKSYFEQAKVYADQCKQYHPSAWQTNYALALSIGSLQQLSESKEFKKQAAKLSKELIDKALKANPTHADSWSVLGMWHYRMANLGWKESLFVGDLKNGASNEEAKKCLQRALQLDPNDLKFYLMIAKICQALEQNDEAKVYLKQAIERAGRRPESQFITIKSKELLKEIENK